MNQAADRGGVFALMDAIEKAWNAGDVKSYARLYAPSASYVTRAGVLWKGRKAIERGHAAAFRSDLKGTTPKIRITRVRFLTPKTAVAHCMVELSEGARQAGRKIHAITRFELRKNGARWEILVARMGEISARRK